MATVEDKKTGVHFPTSFTPPGSDKSMTVLGCGLREKHVMGVNLHVYSISCHVDPEAAKKALAAFQGKGASRACLAFRPWTQCTVQPGRQWPPRAPVTGTLGRHL